MSNSPANANTDAEFKMATDVIYGELTDEVNQPRWSVQVGDLRLIARSAYEATARVAEDLALPDPISRRAARAAALSLVLGQVEEELRAAYGATDTPPATGA